MTIPSIGGNDSFGDKIKINHHMNIEQPSSDNKKVAIDDENEYSVQKFKEDYNNIFHSQVFPIIIEYDEERKKTSSFCGNFICNFYTSRNNFIFRYRIAWGR